MNDGADPWWRSLNVYQLKQYERYYYYQCYTIIRSLSYIAYTKNEQLDELTYLEDLKRAIRKHKSCCKALKKKRIKITRFFMKEGNKHIKTQAKNQPSPQKKPKRTNTSTSS